MSASSPSATVSEPDARERLRRAMLFIEEWSNWWSYALGVDDNAPMPEAEKAAAEKMAESLGARARDMVIENRRFLASSAEQETSLLRAHVLGPRTLNAAPQEPGSPQRSSKNPAASAAPSETPRTDEIEARVEGEPNAFALMTDHARQLERELSETRAKYERLQQSAVGWQERIEELTGKSNLSARL